MNIDPLAENYFEKSVYTYSGNNPIIFVDYDGKDYGVYVDHDSKSITLKSKYMVKSVDNDLMNKIASFFNNSNNYVYSVGEGKDAVAYSIGFKIEIEVNDNQGNNQGFDFSWGGNDVANESHFSNERNEINSFVTSSQHPSFLTSNNIGVTGGHDAIVKKGVGGELNTGAHEVGHNFGMSHSYGLMYESNNPEINQNSNLDIFSVQESLGRVGLGKNVKLGTDGGTGARANINEVKGIAPAQFNAGTVMTKQKFDKNMNKTLRKNRG